MRLSSWSSFQWDCDIKEGLQLATLTVEFYEREINILIKRYDKRINNEGYYIEK